MNDKKRKRSTPPSNRVRILYGATYRNGEPFTVAAMAERLHVKTSTLTGTISDMKAKGEVVRAKDTNMGVAQYIKASGKVTTLHFLRPAGRELVEVIRWYSRESCFR